MQETSYNSRMRECPIMLVSGMLVIQRKPTYANFNSMTLQLWHDLFS